MTIPTAQQVDQAKTDLAAAQTAVATNMVLLAVGYTQCGSQLMALSCQRCGPTTQQSGSSTAKKNFGYTIVQPKFDHCIQTMSAAEHDVVVDLMLNDSPAPNAFDELKATTERGHTRRRPTCCASFRGFRGVD